MGKFCRQFDWLFAGVSTSIISVVLATAPVAAQDGISDLIEKHPTIVVNEPDRFAWRLFVEINKQVSEDNQETVWETWATDEETFPAAPDPDNPPTWPGGIRRAKTLRPNFQLLLIQTEAMQASGQPPGAVPQIVPGGSQEVRRNKPAFDYIMENELFYLEGLILAVENQQAVDLPREAVEIKAAWKRITEADKPRYHWNLDDNGDLFGLTALHITSKAIDIWHWSTFEHLDNPRRGVPHPCRDEFGVTPPNTNDGAVSAELTTLMTDAGLQSAWRNYRLVDSQVDFIDLKGDPTIVGNTEIETDFETTSSCTTCHARAAVNSNGEFLTFMKSFVPREGHVGSPDPAWFNDPGSSVGYLQLDFVWGFMKVSPANP